MAPKKLHRRDVRHDPLKQLLGEQHIVEGIENFPNALITLLTGGHMGKMLVVP